MITKLFLLQVYIFDYAFVRTVQKDFNRASSTLKIFLLAFLVSPENIKFRNEIVL